MYFTTTSPSGEALIIHLSGNLMRSFTENPENSDYIAFQAWMAEGNTPEPWPPAE